MEVEGVLNPAAARGPDGRLYLFPETCRAWKFFSHRHCPRKIQTKLVIRQVLSGSALRSSLKPIMSGDLTAAAAARMPALPLSNRSNITS